MIKSKICDLLGIKYPIIQGGMAWVADASLAAAVSNAGGLGIITGACPPDIVREEIRKCKQMTDKPFGVNIMLQAPEVEKIAQIVVELRFLLQELALLLHSWRCGRQQESRSFQL